MGNAVNRTDSYQDILQHTKHPSRPDGCTQDFLLSEQTKPAGGFTQPWDQCQAEAGTQNKQTKKENNTQNKTKKQLFGSEHSKIF